MQLPPTLRLTQWLLVVARVLLSGTPLGAAAAQTGAGAESRPAPVQLALENTETQDSLVERRLASGHVLSSRQKFCQNKMGIFSLILCLALSFSSVKASILKIDENFKYQRISVEVSDKVPRHLCQNTLDHLEVRATIFMSKNLECQLRRLQKLGVA